MSYLAFASSTQDTWAQADRCCRYPERDILYDPLGLFVAHDPQEFSAVHHGSEPLLRMAGQRFVDANHERFGDGRARSVGQWAGPIRGRTLSHVFPRFPMFCGLRMTC